MTLLQNQCEFEGSHMLNILMVAMENTRFAGYIQAGNRSKNQDIDGKVAWLYHCPKFLCALIVLDKCFDRIPILFERTTKCLDPITL